MRGLVLAAAALALSACMTGPSYSSLKPGATKAQVVAAMNGCPSTVVKRGNYEARTYAGRMLSFFQWAPSTYTFILKDDVLVAFGEGTAREASMADGPGYELVPLPKA